MGLQPDVYLSKLMIGMQVYSRALQSVAFVFTCFLVLPVAWVEAQQYGFEKGGNNSALNAQVIENGENLQYVYGIISGGAELVDYYRVTFSHYTPNVQFSLLVPNDAKLNNFKPSLIVTDPSSTRMFGTAPFGFPPQVGGRVFPWSKEKDNLFTDDKTFEKLRIGPSVVKDVTASSYLVAVYDPTGQWGRYVLKIGAKPAVSNWKDNLRFVADFIRIKLRLY